MKGLCKLQCVMRMFEEISKYLVAAAMQVTFANTAIMDYQNENRPKSSPTLFSRLREHTGHTGVLLHKPRRRHS